MHTLKIENLTIKIEDKIILNNFNLTMNSGEIHVLMGPNGVGKSTLTKVIMGSDEYKIISGTIKYDDKLLNELDVNERANLGVFLGFQLPPAIEGVTNADFLRTALHTKNKDNFKLLEFIRTLDKMFDKLNMNKEMIHRGINAGFSGGERKKNEILQMYILNPSLIMLDEIDSGLDVDSLKIVGNAINEYYQINKPILLLITHYNRLLTYIKPTHVHIIKDGMIVKTGDYKLVSEIEDNGYNENLENTSNINEVNSK